MDSWRHRLASQREELLNDDDEDDLVLLVMIESLGVENEVVERRDPGGSRPGKRANIKRNYLEGHEKMFRDYFAETPTYPPGMFRCWYSMQRSLFLRIMEVVC
jgi:hypothetical protein